MRLNYFIVDAFAEEVFKGNPAAVYVLNEWLPDDTMQKIAIENNLSETAFTVIRDNYYELRWFTPDREIDLCGHATLATAFVLFNYFDINDATIEFRTRFSGKLFVKKKKDLFQMDFPSLPPEQTEILVEYEEALGVKIQEAYLGRDLFFVISSENEVAKLAPNFSKMEQLEKGVGVIVTAPGKSVDFVSRTFFPKLTINEDPVCGSAHSNLIPYWASKLNKKTLVAHQLSKRSGELYCELLENRVLISGRAVMYAEGIAYI